MSDAQLEGLRLACAGCAETIDGRGGIADVVKTAARSGAPGAVAGPSSSDGSGSGSGDAAATTTGAAQQPLDPLAALDRTVQLLASAEMERNRVNAGVLLLWLHCMSVLSTTQMATG